MAGSDRTSAGNERRRRVSQRTRVDVQPIVGGERAAERDRRGHGVPKRRGARGRRYSRAGMARGTAAAAGGRRLKNAHPVALPSGPDAHPRLSLRRHVRAGAPSVTHGEHAAHGVEFAAWKFFACDLDGKRPATSSVDVVQRGDPSRIHASHWRSGDQILEAQVNTNEPELQSRYRIFGPHRFFLSPASEWYIGDKSVGRGRTISGGAEGSGATWGVRWVS